MDKVSLCSACKKQCSMFKKAPEQVVVDCGRFEPDKDKPELLAELVIQNWTTPGSNSSE